MLVLSRRKEEKIVIGGDVEVVVLGITHDGVKLGVSAPRSVAVVRGEIYEEVASSNRAAARAKAPDPRLVAALRENRGTKKEK